MTSPLTTLVGEDLGEGQKWMDSVFSNANNHVYGIPLLARRVLKFNPIDKSSTPIGPDLGDNRYKYIGGTEDEKGCIYCTPNGYWNECGMLKIDTNTDTVTVLDARPPEEGGHWSKGVLGLDGNIYFMPTGARRILKLNTDTDTFESVGDDLGGGSYWGAVRGIDGCIYGIPDDSKRIVKYDPVSGVTSYVGKKHKPDFKYRCISNGALARDGFIYALSGQGVFKINTNNDGNGNDTSSWALVGNRVNMNICGNAIAGIDGCVYWPQCRANIIKHDPHIDHTSLVGDDFGDKTSAGGWYGGALASDGVIYCMPYTASQVLAIDPFREFTETLTSDMRQFPPEEFGGLFELLDKGGGKAEGGITKFDYIIAKFGQRGFQIIADLLPSATEAFPTNQQLYPFMVAASLPNSALSVIYHLVRQGPELMRRH